jgi:hypothetical protein
VSVTRWQILTDRCFAGYAPENRADRVLYNRDMQLLRQPVRGRNLRLRRRLGTDGSLGRRIDGKVPADWDPSWDPSNFGKNCNRTRRSFPALGRNFLARKQSAFGRGPIGSRSTRSMQSAPGLHGWHVSYPKIPFLSISGKGQALWNCHRSNNP